MRNFGIFGLGCLTGIVIGGTVTYFAVKNKFKEKAIQEVEEYAKYAEEKLDRAIDSLHDDSVDDPEDDEEKMDSDDNFNIISKYHKYVKASGENPQSIFEKKEDKKEVTEGQKAILKDPSCKKLNEGIFELSEDKFEALEDANIVYLDYDVNADTLVWGSGTDNEMLAEHKFNKDREELMGQCWRWATDYVDSETGVGTIYIDNQNINKTFVITIHFDPDGDFVE